MTDNEIFDSKDIEKMFGSLVDNCEMEHPQ